MDRFKLALAQTKPRLGDLKWNMQNHIETAERAATEGANLILFPELSMTGYVVRDLNSELAMKSDDTFFEPLKAFSRKASVAFGAIIRDDTGAIRNAVLYMEDGTLKHVHSKVYLPTYGLFEEQRYFLPGKMVQAFDTKFGKIGLLICEDLWHVSLPYLLAVQGAKIILGSAVSPTRLSGDSEEHSGRQVNSEQHRSLARLLSVYIAFANRVGFEDGVNFWGGSELVSPHGGVVASAKLFDEDLVVADVDVAEVDRARLFARHFLDEDPELMVRHLKALGY